MSFFSVGVTALNAAQLSLSTTGHNISNVNTDGYHRQTTIQATNIAVQTGAGFVGQGTHVETITRIYSQFLDNQVLQAQTRSSHFNSYLSNISQLDNIVADPSAGLSPALDEFFASVNDVATSPDSIPSRQSLLSSASALVTRFQSLEQRFTEIRQGVNSQIAEHVDTINAYASEIARLNETIVIQTGGSGQPPNDLLDQRDNLVLKLNELVRATVVKQSDGGLNVFIGNGQPLVVGQQAMQLVTMASPEDAQRDVIGYQTGSTVAQLPDDNLTGGSLGGLLEFRSEILDPAENSLGRIAISLAQTFNAQHALGQDLNGNLGGDFFELPTPTVISSSKNTGTGALTGTISDSSALTTSDYRIRYDGANYLVTDLATDTTSTVAPGALSTAIPGVTLTLSGTPASGDVFTVQPTRNAARNIELASTLTTKTIAAAAPIAVNAATSNAGDVSITSSGVTSVTGLPLGSNITLTYNSTTNEFAVAGAAPAVANITFSSGTAMTINGITVTLSGNPANGDVFTIGNNVNGTSDNRNALLLAKLQVADTMIGGTASYSEGYGQMVSLIGNKTAEVKVTAAAEENLLEQASNAQQELSGVNLDEEAANLLRFQQAYQAAAKMMQIASTLFDELLAIGG